MTMAFRNISLAKAAEDEIPYFSRGFPGVGNSALEYGSKGKIPEPHAAKPNIIVPWYNRGSCDPVVYDCDS